MKTCESREPQVPLAAPAIGNDTEGREGGEWVAAVEARLRAIIQELDGCNVGTNGDTLWFEPARTPGVQLRLNGPESARSFARSANFTISYGAQTSDGVDTASLQTLADNVKAVDATPIAGVTKAFRAAAASVAGRLPSVARPPQWECNDETQPLNIVFLDLCTRLFRFLSPGGDAVAPLHWGYWPSGQPPNLDLTAYDAPRAYSDALLAHVPDGVSRILDVGCGLGFNARLLASQGFQVTAISPVAAHCATLEEARLPGVEVVCTRFGALPAEPRYDLLLFSESLNHFLIDDAFLEHCRSFLADPGYLLWADDLTEEQIEQIESQGVFRILRRIDITDNVAPTMLVWERQLRMVTGYHAALMSILELSDATLATRVREIVAGVKNAELRQLFAGQPPEPKGRYMIYLLAPVTA